MGNMTVNHIISDLKSYINAEKAEVLPRFFKTGKGEYGEGDFFLGIVVPDIRRVAKANKDISLNDIHELLQSKYHECRMCALLILVAKFAKANEEERKKIVDFYVAHIPRINNWDLVDLSAPKILGLFFLDKPCDLLYELASRDFLWAQRIAILSTFPLIKNGDFEDFINLSTKLMHHEHDLMHKAIGWMLREMGKVDKQCLLEYLDLYAKQMPRTMLRYSIEKLSKEERAHYMAR